MKGKINAKLAVRIAILVVGLAGAFIAANTQPISLADGGPIFTCLPSVPTCQVNLPPMS